jgi:hypothetical protein
MPSNSDEKQKTNKLIVNPAAGVIDEHSSQIVCQAPGFG